MAQKKIPTKCAECNKTLTTTKYCPPCGLIVHKRQSKERNAREYERRKVLARERAMNEKDMPSGVIDEKYLVRGRISTSGTGCAMTQEA